MQTLEFTMTWYVAPIQMENRDIHYGFLYEWNIPDVENIIAISVTNYNQPASPIAYVSSYLQVGTR